MEVARKEKDYDFVSRWQMFNTNYSVCNFWKPNSIFFDVHVSFVKSPIRCIKLSTALKLRNSMSNTSNKFSLVIFVNPIYLTPRPPRAVKGYRTNESWKPEILSFSNSSRIRYFFGKTSLKSSFFQKRRGYVIFLQALYYRRTRPKLTHFPLPLGEPTRCSCLIRNTTNSRLTTSKLKLIRLQIFIINFSVSEFWVPKLHEINSQLRHHPRSWSPVWRPACLQPLTIFEHVEGGSAQYVTI